MKCARCQKHVRPRTGRLVPLRIEGEDITYGLLHYRCERGLVRTMRRIWFAPPAPETLKGPEYLAAFQRLAAACERTRQQAQEITNE